LRKAPHLQAGLNKYLAHMLISMKCFFDEEKMNELVLPIQGTGRIVAGSEASSCREF